MEYVVNKLADIFIQNHIIDEEDKEIYAYGMEIFFSSLIGILFVSIIGLVLNRFRPALLYMIMFSALRTVAGGSHAKTHIGCILTYAGMCFSSLFIREWLMTTIYYETVMIILLIMAIAMVYFYAPIDHFNLRFSKEEYSKHRVQSIMVLAVQTVIIGFLYWAGEFTNFGVVVLAVTSEALTLLPIFNRY